MTTYLVCMGTRVRARTRVRFCMCDFDGCFSFRPLNQSFCKIFQLGKGVQIYPFVTFVLIHSYEIIFNFLLIQCVNLDKVIAHY